MLPEKIQAVRRVAADRDSAALLALLRELRTQAALHGFETISRSADRVEHTAQLNADLQDPEIAIQEVAGVCRRAGTVGT